MDTEELYKWGKKLLGPVFISVFSAHQAPDIIQRRPAALIVNTDTYDKPGKHWIAMYFDKNGKGRFFDSYGRKPSFLRLCWKHFMDNNSNEWTFNKIQVQKSGSNLCGVHCLMYLLERSRNPHAADADILKDFSDTNMEKIADLLQIKV